jgi:serine protease Do
MSRRFAIVTVALTAVVAFLVGLTVAGALTPAPAASASRLHVPSPRADRALRTSDPAPALPPGAINFADIAARINPAVVNIDATSRHRSTDPRLFPEDDELGGETPDWRRNDTPSKGTGSGFIIDSAGYILTNHHVVSRAERISVKLADGRNLRAQVIGSDADTDIALIKVDARQPLPVAPIGDSDALRVGEWVCAIGNPLAYEHTVTVGVVSFLGRKLFDPSLDDYIQTDAAINFGNSGGPLINGRGEVIGINSAISSRASNIGFAVPVNQATAVLAQLKEHGRVARGYIGVVLRDVDPDLRRSLRLPVGSGALVQDITPGSPGDRAGLRTYDLVVAVDGVPVAGTDQLIHKVSARAPGTIVRLDLLRDGRPVPMRLKLGERPVRERLDGQPAAAPERPVPSSSGTGAGAIGLVVRPLDREVRHRFQVPSAVSGVLVTRVEPMSPAFDAEIARGAILLEINRRPVSSVGEYERLTASARAGDVLAFYLYLPESGQRSLRTVRIDAP